MHFIVVLILNKNVRSGLEYFIPEHENEFLVRLDAEISKVLNIKQHHLLPAAEPILILNKILLHGILDIREDRDDLVECFLSDVSNIAITLGLDRGRPPVVGRDQRDFAEVCAGSHQLHKRLVSILIVDGDIAFTLRNKIQLLRTLRLPDDNVLRVVHLQLHFGEEDINQLLIILKHVIRFDDVLENELDDLVLQTWRDVLDEQCQLLLILLTLLCILKEADDSRLEWRVKADVLHGSVYLIKLLLESISLPVEILNQHGHVTQNVSIDDGAHRIRKHNEEHLKIADGERIVTSHEKHRVVN